MRVLRALPPQAARLSSAGRRSLSHAVQAAIAGNRSLARREIEIALTHDPDVAAARLIAAQIHHALHDYQLALDELDRARDVGAGTLDEELRYHFTARIGWNHESRAVVERRLADPGERNQRMWRGRAARLFASARHYEGALGHIEKLIAISAPSAKLELNAAELLARIGRHDDARERALSAIALEPDRAPLASAAASILGDGAFWEDAFAAGRRSIELTGAAEAHATVGELWLAVGDLEAAEASARRCLEADPAHATAHRIHGAVAVLRGAHEKAIAHLQDAARLDDIDAECHVWSADALLRLERFDEAIDAVDRALARTDRYLFAAHVLRLLATLRGEARDGARSSVGESLFQELREGCAEIHPASVAEFESGDRARAIAALDAVLIQLGSSRGVTQTWIGEPGARPRPLVARTGPRFASRVALGLLRIEPLDVVLSRLDAVAARYPRSGLPLAHRGEANLWMGRYGDAKRDLERAIELHPSTRWAYIGLTEILNLEGRFEDALAVSARGVARIRSVGPAVYVHRGEAFLGLGRLAEAIADLEIAHRLHPERFGATVDLSLAYYAARRDEEASALYHDLVRTAPALFSDAAYALGLVGWDREDLGADAQIRALELARGMMLGNRSSSCPTYVMSDGVVRTAPTGLEVPPGTGRLDTDALSDAAQWLKEQKPRADARVASRRRSDVELIALRAGLRTAVRASIVPTDVDRMVWEYERAGMAAIVSDITATYDGEKYVIVLAGRTERDALRALDAERAKDHVALGRLLGYPACCVDAFVERRGTGPFDGARAAWAPRPVARLNNLMFGIGARLISFEPCRYDCPRAVAVADALAAAMGAVSEHELAWCEGQLVSTIVIDATDARAHAELEGGSGELRVASARPIPSVFDRVVEANAIALAARLTGVVVPRDRSVLAIDGAPELCLLDFAWASRARA